jgi:outer membrane receptor protein involved in Fe transport
MRKSLTLLLISLSLLAIAFAGTTGKIAGRVTDAQTGEPLAGVNVVIEGTSMGAATDMEGRFVILNLPPATYNVNASMIGYSPMLLKDVRVEIDLTTSINIEMKTAVLQGEIVEVVAEKKVIRKDVAASQQSITSEEITALPVSSVTDVLGLRAGITSDLTIRGSSSTETMFMVDGIVLRDQRDNSPITSVPLSSMQEISVQTGGFSAEYNNVRSGVVNVVTKEGNPKFYDGSVTFKYSSPHQKHFGISPFDPNSYWLRPYLDDEVCWNGTSSGAWDIYQQDEYVAFNGWNTASQNLLSNSDESDDMTPYALQRLFKWQHRKKGYINQPDFNIDFGVGGPVPMVSSQLGNLRFFFSHRTSNEQYLMKLATDNSFDQNTMLKVTSDISPSMKLSILAMYGELHATSESRSGLTDMMSTVWDVANNISSVGFTTPWRIYGHYWCPTSQYYSTLTAKLTNIVDPDTYWEVQLKRTYKKYHTAHEADRDTAAVYEIFPGYYVNEAPEGYSAVSEYAVGDAFALGGAIQTSFDRSKVTGYSAKYDYTSQLNFRNQLKTGLEINLDNYDMKFGLFNEFLPSSNVTNIIKINPIRIVGYTQDKLEYEGFITTVGLVGELIHANSKWYDVDVFDKGFYSNSFDPSQEDEYKTKTIKPKFYLSPRLNVSHPITVNSKLYFNYGHNREMPTAQTLYRVQRTPDNQLKYIGDPTLPLTRTISYELGYDHALMRDYLFHLAAYYKDVDNVNDWTLYQTADGKVNYYKLTSNAYEDIRGFEMEFSKLYGRWFTGNINFEYRVSTSGYFGTREYYDTPAAQREYDLENTYQSKPRPIPRLKATFDFHTPENYGMLLNGQRIFGGWHANFVTSWRKGSYTTWNPNNYDGVLYNLRYKDYHNINLQFSKVFVFNRFKVKFFADITNLDNFKYWSTYGFFDTNDYYDYMYSLHLPSETYEECGYNGIPGDDQPGDYRKSGVDYQPMSYTTNYTLISSPDSKVIYWDAATKKYMQYVDGAWTQVSKSKINKILDEKAYINMPDQSFYTFLDPRNIFFGVTMSFDFK